MSRASEFAKTTFLGGLVAIVPLSVVAFILWTVLSVLIELINAMEGVLPFSPLFNTAIVFLAALVALIALCFLAGLVLRTTLGNTIKNAVERILEKVVPLYGTAKKLTQRLAGHEGREFTPAQIDLYGSSSRVLGWIVEPLPDDRSAVYVPLTPAATIGQVYVVANSQIEPIELPLGDVIRPITEWGAGMAKLFEKRQDKGE